MPEKVVIEYTPVPGGLPLKQTRLQRFFKLLGFGSTRISEGGAYMVKDPRATTAAGYKEENPSNLRGNKYTNYHDMVCELTKKIEGEAVYGCGPAQALVGFMAAQIHGTGAKLSAIDTEQKPANETTEEFLKAYARWNQTDSQGFFDTVTITTIEGKVIRVPEVVASDDPRDKEWGGKKVITKSVRFAACPYTIHKDGRVTFKDKEENDALKAGSYVLIQTDGFLDDPNKTATRAAKCLNSFEALDHALSDFRLSNKTFPAATPVFSVPDMQAAQYLHDQMFLQVGTHESGEPIYKMIWEIGQALIIPGGTAMMLQQGEAGFNALVAEIMMQFRVISGIGGAPVIFLGPVDLPSNRATQQEQPEMINAATIGSREAHKNGLLREIELSAKILGAALKKEIPTEGIDVDVPFVNMAWMELIAEFYMKLGLADIVSKKTIRNMIPTVDNDDEEEQIEAENKKRMEEARKSFETTGGETDPAEDDMDHPKMQPGVMP